MAAYRLYAMDGLGRINLADWIHAESDEEAVAKARQVEHGRVICEVWLQRRLVCTLRSGELGSESPSSPERRSERPSRLLERMPPKSATEPQILR